MNIVIHILVFMLGIFLGLQLLCAFFLLIDFCYVRDKRKAAVPVFTFIIIRVAVAAILFMLLANLQIALSGGIIGFVVLHAIVRGTFNFFVGKAKRELFLGE